MARVTRGLGALAVLLIGVVGVPLALLVLSGDPWPRTLSWAGLEHALLRPDDGRVLVGVVTLVGWVAWLVFAASVLGELVTLATHHRVRVRLPGLAGPQRFAAGLLVSVVALVAVHQLSAVAPSGTTSSTVTTHQPPAPVTAPAVVPPPAPPLAAPADPAVAGTTHHVQPGDDLWSLAERYYGHGREWRRIAAANPRLLTGGPDRLQPGWRLLIPQHAPADEPGKTVEVRAGDSLTSIAERELGSADRWSEVFRLNRSQLSDPDEIIEGMLLKLPGQSRPTAAAAKPDATERVTPAAPPPASTAPPAEQPAPEPTTARPAPAAAEPEPPISDAPTSATDEHGPEALLLAGVGGVLAAGLLTGLRARRRVQLRSRPLGRRILHPDPSLIRVEVALGRRQRPLSLRTLDRALRAIAAHCRTQQIAPPPLLLALVSDSEIELVMAAPTPQAPVGFTVRGRSWVLGQSDARYLSSVPGLSDAIRPWPTLVTLGHDEQERLVLADVESLGLLRLEDSEQFDASSALAAMAVELSFSPWADEMILTLVGPAPTLPEALGKHNVSQTSDLDGLLTRLENRARVQRAHHPFPVLGQHRIDPDLADPWAPEIVLIDQPMTDHQQQRLRAVMLGEPRVTMAAVVAGPVGQTPWTLGTSTEHRAQVRLDPMGLRLRPQQLTQPDLASVVELVDVTGSEVTTAAAWWSEAEERPDPPPDNVTYLGRRFDIGAVPEGEGGQTMTPHAQLGGGPVHHPTLLLIGPIELVGATGVLPPRAGRQCLEYCGWLLEHPGTTAQAMASALAVAEGTRRSNMSRLRSWLGDAPEGDAYLPDAYTGRIRLHAAVSSDWHRLQILTVGGVNRASRDSLEAALSLVRGAPLADAAPGQWHWAEELRTDIASCVRDIGVELTNRALDAGDLDLARWAAARALVVAPGDELLMAGRIRTEHLAGNPAETERLTLQLAAQARNLGVDLDPETVVLLQQVMEGRVRARMA